MIIYECANCLRKFTVPISYYIAYTVTFKLVGKVFQNFLFDSTDTASWCFRGDNVSILYFDRARAHTLLLEEAKKYNIDQFTKSQIGSEMKS